MSETRDPAGAVEIDLAEPSPLWRRAVPELDRLCERAARAALAAGGAPPGPVNWAQVDLDLWKERRAL